MGERLGCDPDVVDTAGLAHDLGHPPFGHNGEDALDEAAAAVRRLRGQRADAAGADPAGGQGGRPGRRSVGLNLTRASLDADVQVPVAAPGRASASSACTPTTPPVFDWLRAGAPPAAERRCLEAQVMDWADDVAYSVHDVEDGIHAGLRRLRPAAARRRRAGRAVRGRGRGVLRRAGRRPRRRTGRPARRPGAAPRWPTSTAASGALVALKRAASVLIGRFVAAAVAATRARVRRRAAAPLRRRPGGAAAGPGRSARCSRASRCGT